MTNKKNARKALGRGLSALISAAPVPVSPSTRARGEAAIQLAERASAPRAREEREEGLHYLPIERLINNPEQPRREFKEQEIKELSDSIRANGVLQPVLVRASKVKDGAFEIIAGERRWRAAKIAGLSHLPVLITSLSDKEALEVALVENIQRQDLNPVEEARGYQRLAQEFGLSQKEIAERVGKDRASVANFLRLLNLPDPVLEMMRTEQITMGHAKALLTIKEPVAQLSLARKVVKENLSVRALETIVSRVVVLDVGKPTAGRAAARRVRSADDSFPEVSDRLRKVLGTKVIIRHHSSGKGKIEIEYFSEQELDRLVDVICHLN